MPARVGPRFPRLAGGTHERRRVDSRDGFGIERVSDLTVRPDRHRLAGGGEPSTTPLRPKEPRHDHDRRFGTTYDEATRRRRFLIAGALAAATLGTAVAPASAQTADLNLTGTFTENGAGGTVDLDWDALPGTTNYWVFLNGNIVSPASSGATIDADGTGFRWSDSWSFNITGTWTVCASVCDSVTLTRPAAADPTIDVTVQRSGTRFWTATVDVHDANGDPLTNSTITGHWTNGASGSVYLALGADGINTTPRVRSTTNKRPVFVVDEVTYVGPDYMTVRYRP